MIINKVLKPLMTQLDTRWLVRIITDTDSKLTIETTDAKRLVRLEAALLMFNLMLMLTLNYLNR